MNRRNFFKLLAGVGAVGALAPKLLIASKQYLEFYDGQQWPKTVTVRQPTLEIDFDRTKFNGSAPGSIGG